MPEGPSQTGVSHPDSSISRDEVAPLTIGLIGCGGHASNVIVPAISRTPLRLTAVCDRDVDRAEAVAARTGAIPYADAGALLQRDDLDAVAVVGPPDLHVRAGLAVLASGRHLFVEKPPGSTLDEARRLLRAGEEAGKQVMVGFMKRHAVAYRHAATIIDRPDFGTLRLVRLVYSHWRFPGLRDHLLFMSSHALDLVRHFAGDVAVGCAFKRSEGENHVLSLMLEHVGGAVSTLSLSAFEPRVQEVLELEGDSTLIEVRNLIELRYQRAAPNIADAHTDDRMASMWYPDFAIPGRLTDSGVLQGYVPQFEEFAEAIRSGRRPRPDIRDGVEVLRLVEAILAAPAGLSTLRLPD